LKHQKFFKNAVKQTEAVGTDKLFILYTSNIVHIASKHLYADDTFIHYSLFVYLWKYAIHPQLTQPQLGVTKNLKSTYMSIAKTSGDQVVSCPIVDGWKYEDVLRW